METVQKTTPRDFFLWAGAMISLYVSVFALITLLFQYIEYAYPDQALPVYGDPYSSVIRFSIASLIVLFPTFLLLSHIIRRTIAADSSRAQVWVRRWALYLVLFIAGAGLAADLVTLINTYLSGEVTMRFLLKVAVVFLVASAFFMHYLAELRGYWQVNPKRLRVVACSSLFLVAAVIFSGFLIVGSPAASRLYAADEKKVQDLTSIQWQIVSYWQTKNTLPSTLSDLSDEISGYRAPTDTQLGKEYGYTKVSATAFKLCAEFNKESRPGFFSVPAPSPAVDGISSKDGSWVHGAGENCFVRSIDTDRYRPLTGKATD